MTAAQVETVRRYRRNQGLPHDECLVVTTNGVFVCFTDARSMHAMAREEYYLRRRWRR